MTPLEREIKILTSAGLSEEFIINHYRISTEIPLKVTFVFTILLWSMFISSVVAIYQGIESLNPFTWLVGMVVSTLYWHVIFSVNQKELLVHLGYGEYHIVRVPNEQLISEDSNETPSSR